MGGSRAFPSRLRNKFPSLANPMVTTAIPIVTYKTSPPLQQQHRQRQRQRPSSVCPLNVVTDREPDILEMMLGGERYEMVPLPDRMCDTTVFVGNLCEFVHDNDLSQLFQTVSILQSVPACVVRKANMQSLGYGFVSFLTVEEKEAAILRYHGCEWRGKRIKVEAIRDGKGGRVRVPERMVTYVSGSLKKTRSGKVNSMRNARGDDAEEVRRKKKQKANKKRRALAANGAASGSSASHRSRLSTADQAELLRACKKGFLTLDGRKAGHGSLTNLCSSEALKGLRLAVVHREWCDEREKPNIILYKASGRHSREVLDHIVVDLSPLRDQVAAENCEEDILNAAHSAGMDLQLTKDAQECATDLDNSSQPKIIGRNVVNTSGCDTAGQRRPIAKLPFVSMGFFVGERSNAKAMAKELALLWEIPELEDKPEDSDESSSNSHHTGGRYENNHGKVGKIISNPQDRRRAKRRKIRRDDWEQTVRH